MNALQQRELRRAKGTTPRAEQPPSRETSSPGTADSRLCMDHDTFDMNSQPKCRWIKPETNRKVPVLFKVSAPHAVDVRLVADFTAWDTAPFRLVRNSDGVWAKTILLRPGRYEYKFIVDGQWISDPECARSVPNRYGSVNSVAEVKA